LGHLGFLLKCKQHAEVLVGAARAVKEIVEMASLHRELAARARDHMEALQHLREADPDLYDCSVKPFAALDLPPVAGGESSSPALEVQMAALRAANFELWQLLGGPDIIKRWWGWRNAILGDPPFIADAGKLLAPRSLYAKDPAPITGLLVRAIVAQTRLQEDLKRMLPAFVRCVAELIPLKTISATHWVLIEVASGIDSQCCRSHANGDGSDPDYDRCRRDHDTRVKKWQLRITPRVRELQEVLDSPPPEYQRDIVTCYVLVGKALRKFLDDQ
jgi:hypothetical protein